MHGSMASSASKVAKCVVGMMLALGQQQVCGYSPIVAPRRQMAHQCKPPARHRTASRAILQAVAINDAIAPVAGVQGWGRGGTSFATKRVVRMTSPREGLHAFCFRHDSEHHARTQDLLRYSPL
jgi:hypothetical protein